MVNSLKLLKRYLWSDTGMRICPHLFCDWSSSSIWHVKAIISVFYEDLWRKCRQIWPVVKILWPWTSSFPSAACHMKNEEALQSGLFSTAHWFLLAYGNWLFWRRQQDVLYMGKCFAAERELHTYSPSLSSPKSCHAANPCLVQETSRNWFTHCSWK